VVMQNPETYLRVFWDFKGEVANGTQDIWTMPVGGGYPVLAWQIQDSSVINDDISQAIEITAGSVVTGSTVGVTGLDITNNGYKDCLDVWYVLVPDESDKFTVSVTGSGFDPTLGIFDPTGQEVAFNDDFFGDKASVILKALAGTSYYLRVAGYGGQTGHFTLTIEKGTIQMIQGDLNYDGKVNLVDLSVMAGNWLMGM
jgi:hypothetical protein